MEKNQTVIDLMNLPDDVVIDKDCVFITHVDVPLYFPDGTIGGKARIVEGDAEDAILIEVESSNPMVAAMFRNEIIGMSLVQKPA